MGPATGSAGTTARRARSGPPPAAPERPHLRSGIRSRRPVRKRDRPGAGAPDERGRAPDDAPPRETPPWNDRVEAPRLDRPATIGATNGEHRRAALPPVARAAPSHWRTRPVPPWRAVPWPGSSRSSPGPSRGSATTPTRQNGRTRLRPSSRASGAKLTDLYWTLGPYDLVAVSEFPDDETASAAALQLAAGGNVRTTTMRAFGRDEVKKIIARAKGQIDARREKPRTGRGSARHRVAAQGPLSGPLRRSSIGGGWINPGLASNWLRWQRKRRVGQVHG